MGGVHSTDITDTHIHTHITHATHSSLTGHLHTQTHAHTNIASQTAIKAMPATCSSQPASQRIQNQPGQPASHTHTHTASPTSHTHTHTHTSPVLGNTQDTHTHTQNFDIHTYIRIHTYDNIHTHTYITRTHNTHAIH